MISAALLYSPVSLQWSLTWRFFIYSMLILKFLSTNITNFCFFTFCCSFVSNFILLFLKLIIPIACSLKNLQNFFIQSLPLYTSCLFSMLLKWWYCKHWKTWWNIYSLTFTVDEVSGLFLHPSTSILWNIQDLHK